VLLFLMTLCWNFELNISLDMRGVRCNLLCAVVQNLKLRFPGYEQHKTKIENCRFLLANVIPIFQKLFVEFEYQANSECQKLFQFLRSPYLNHHLNTQQQG
jgi:hypothetical protein